MQNRLKYQLREITELLQVISRQQEKAIKCGTLHSKRLDYISTEMFFATKLQITILEKGYVEFKNLVLDFLYQCG